MFNSRQWIITASIICLLIFWGPGPIIYSWTAPDIAAATPDCPMPERTMDDSFPLQTRVVKAKEWSHDEFLITSLAGFSLVGRVLSREDYSHDPGAALSPTDLALGWGQMTKSTLIDQLKISQSARWYSWRTKENFTGSFKEISKLSSNMHIIPANNQVARTLSKVRKDDRIRLDGWLVEAKRESNSWRWRSSLTRNDTGDGACELVYVCAIEIEGKYP